MYHPSFQNQDLECKQLYLGTDKKPSQMMNPKKYFGPLGRLNIFIPLKVFKNGRE